MAVAGPNVGFATLSIIPSLKGVESAISRDLRGPLVNASGKAGDDAGNSFTSGLKRSIGAGAGAIAKAATVGFVAAGAGLAALGAFAINAAGDFQQTRIAFEGILGSAGAADEFLGKLRSFAASTPFEFPELATATQRLLSLGQTGDEAIATLRTIGNAAAAVGAGAPEIEGVVTAIAQIQAKGKLSAEELNQIAERLPNFDRGNFFEILAESAGKSTDEVKKLAEQGLIPADQATAAILKSLEQVPGAMGAMDRQSQTLNGVISTFKDNMRNAIVDGVEPFLPAISGVITKVTPLFTEGLQGLVGGITALVEAFKAGGSDITSSGFAGVMERVGLALRAVVDFFKENSDEIGAVIGTIVDNVVERFTIIADFFKNDVLPALKPVFDALLDVLPDVLDAVNQVGTALLKGVLGALKPILPIVGQVVAALLRFLGVLARNKEILLILATPILVIVGALKAMEIASKIATTIRTFSQSIALMNAVLLANPIILIVAGIAALGVAVFIAYKKFKPFRDVVDAIWQALQDGFDWIVDHWKLLGAILLAPFLPMIAIIVTVVKNWDTLKEAFGKIVEFFTKSNLGKLILLIFAPFIALPMLIAQNWETIVKFFQDLPGRIIGAFDFLLDFFFRLFGTINDTVRNALLGVLSFLTDTFFAAWSAAWNAVKDFLTGIWATITAIVTGAVRAYITFVKAELDLFVTIVRTVIDNVVGFFRNLPGRIFAFVKGVFDVMKGLGGAIIDGLVEGLGKAVGIAGDIATAILGAFKTGWNRLVDLLNSGTPNSLGFGPLSIDLPDNPWNFLKFAQGGVVSGPMGQPVLAVVHGGEEVLTPEQRAGANTVINVFGRSDDDMLRKLAIEQRRQAVLA